MSLYCSDAVPAFAPDVCANEQSRIVAVAYIREDSILADYTSAAEWNAAIAAGTVIVIKNVRGEKPKSTATIIDGFGLQQQRAVGREFALTYEHPDVIGNEDFYNALNYNNSYAIAYYTAGGKVFVVTGAQVLVNADHVITMSLNDSIIFNVEVTWSYPDMPIAYTAPASVFT